MMKKIDMSSKPCPQPVIETKKIIEEEPLQTVEVIVDDEAARVNVTRFAVSRGYTVKEKENGPGRHRLILTPGGVSGSIKEHPDTSKKTGNTVFFIKDYGIGSPDKELGELLIKTFFQTIHDISPLPDKLIFMHGGVKHTVEGSECLDIIKKLENIGIDILVCGTCLDYYKIKNNLKAGRISNFFEIASILNTADNTVTL